MISKQDAYELARLSYRSLSSYSFIDWRKNNRTIMFNMARISFYLQKCYTFCGNQWYYGEGFYFLCSRETFPLKGVSYMKKRAKRIVLPIYLLLFSLLLFGHTQSDRASNESPETTMLSLIEKKDQNSVYVDFNKDLHMHFDHVFLFPPYTVEKEQKKVLGQEWKKIQNIGIANRDDINLLIFVQNGKISNTILLPREYKIKMPRPMNKDYEIPSAVVIEKNADK